MEALADTPVVLIHGPRQCGKTTLAQVVGEREGYAYQPRTPFHCDGIFVPSALGGTQMSARVHSGLLLHDAPDYPGQDSTRDAARVPPHRLLPAGGSHGACPLRSPYGQPRQRLHLDDLFLDRRRNGIPASLQALDVRGDRLTNVGERFVPCGSLVEKRHGRPRGLIASPLTRRYAPRTAALSPGVDAPTRRCPARCRARGAPAQRGSRASWP